MRVIAVAICILSSVSLAQGEEDWPNWRGPHFNGTASATDLPTTWSRTENIAWVADLPGVSAATPIVVGDHVYVSSCDLDRNVLMALCFDRHTGTKRWSRDISEGVRRDTRSTFAAPSPVSDGEVVVFFYGNGELVAFDVDGELMWRRNVVKDYGEFAFYWTFSTSPVLFDGKLILQVLQRDVAVEGRGTPNGNMSYLLALDPKTGNEIWKQARVSQARAESRESFATPMPYVSQGRKQLLVIGGDDLTAHDAATGKELWRWGTWNPQRITHWRHVPSPVIGEDVILVCAPKREPIYAIRDGGIGTRGDDAIAWTSEDRPAVSSDVPTPAFYDGDFFVLSDVRKSLSRVDPTTGEVIWQVKTPGRDKFEASPTVADDKVYIVNFIGDVVVLDAKTGELINNVSMDDPSENSIRSSVIVAGKQLLIRTNRKLYCIGT